MRRQGLWMVVVAAVVGGCAPATSDGETGSPEGEAEGEGTAGLVHSLDVQVEADTVVFTLHVTNAGMSPAILEFGSAQRYDFVVESAGGEVWRWSSGRMFAQVMGADTLAAGATRDYGATWPAGAAGGYMAVGRITSTNSPVELRTEFEIPAS